MSVLKFVPERGWVVLGGYLAEVEVHGEDEHGELGGGGAGPERGGDGLGGGVGLGGDGGLGGGGGRAVKNSIKDLSKLTLCFLLGDGEYLSEVEVHGEDEHGELGDGGYLSGEDGRGGRGGCLLYTSPSPRDRQKSRMPSSA